MDPRLPVMRMAPFDHRSPSDSRANFTMIVSLANIARLLNTGLGAATELATNTGRSRNCFMGEAAPPAPVAGIVNDSSAA